ncbi:MAG: hypothetical protein K0V04_43905 [Deltaproteobacteria bacterium]|nr:hypothetical protein [Deltaproteobacteria bacterium]
MRRVTVGEDLVLEHVDRAADLWQARAALVRSRVHGLQDLAELDGRIRAHLHGAVVAGPAGWSVERWPTSSRPQMAFVALVVAGLLGRRDWIEDVVSHYDSPEAESALISGLGWLPWKGIHRMVDDWLGYHGPRWRALGIAAAIAHRRDPRSAIDRGLMDDDPRVLRQAIRACGVFGRRALHLTLLAVANGASDDVRRRVATALVALGDRQGPIFLWETARRLEGDAALEAAELAVRQISIAKARQWLDEVSGCPRLRRLAVVAATATRSQDCAHHLVAGLDHPETAALATYGFATVFGLNSYAVESAVPEARSADPELPQPDVSAVRQWWAESEPRFDSQTRWQGGHRFSLAVANEVLIYGVQHERRLAAVDLQLDGESSLPFEVDAPGWRQRPGLGLAPSNPPGPSAQRGGRGPNSSMH